MSDHDSEAAAVDAFLKADPADRPRLAPQVVERAGAERLGRIVDATRTRVGGVLTVTDTRDGLAVTGPAGTVLAWAALDEHGRLAALLISPSLRGRRGPSPEVIRRSVRVLAVALIWLRVAACWSAPDVTGWIGCLSVVAAGFVLYEGYWPAAADPRWVRGAVGLGAPAALGSAWRVPGLAVGGARVQAVACVLVAVVGTALLVKARRHRWGVATTAPLAFPLRGSWYVGQGGGRGLNHHVDAPEQRGAVDLVRVGRGGADRGPGRRLTSYPAYDAEVFAPCDGLVVSAVDGLPDQVPGVPRYGPLYGNHVVVDTGTERVVLAHLRPGTVAVAAGERVRTGRLLGRVGNSGNSTEPHLHLHAERDGLGVDLVFADVDGRLYRGRTVRA